MKKLVTGATGFIGSAIVRELLQDGEEVKVFIRETSDTRNIDGLEVERAYGDIRDGDSMKKALAGCDTLYFTAAYFHHWTPDKNLPYEINVGGTKASLQAALEAGVEKVVYTSTNNTMGAHGPVPVDESAEFNHWKTGDNYSLSKYYAEVEARKFVEKGLPIVIVNPTLVIGAHDIKPTPSGSDDHRRRHRPNARVYRRWNERDRRGGCGPRAYPGFTKRAGSASDTSLGTATSPVSDYFNLIAEIAGVKPPAFRIPYHLAVALGYVFELGSAITKKPPVVTASEVRIGKKQEYYDCSKAVKELGLPQTPIEEAIRKALEWFKQNGYLT